MSQFEDSIDFAINFNQLRADYILNPTYEAEKIGFPSTKKVINKKKFL